MDFYIKINTPSVMACHKHLHSSHAMHNIGLDHVYSGQQHGTRGVCVCMQINPNTHCFAHNHRCCQDTFDIHSSSRLLSKRPAIQPEAWSCELNRTLLKENSSTYLYSFRTGAHNDKKTVMIIT